MPTQIHGFGPNGELSPGAAAALEGLGSGGGSTTVQIGTVTLPEDPTEGLSVSVLADSTTVLPEDVTWDSGGEPTITERMLLVFVWSGTDWVGTYGPPIPAVVIPDPEDETPPTPGTLAASSITDTSFTLTVSGATDETALHAAPYAFSTDNGVTYSAWQASNVYNASGLTAETAYDCMHKVRDAAENVATGTAIEVTTEATGATTYRTAVLADSPGVYLPLDDTTWPVVEETGTYTAGMGLTLPTGSPGTTTTAPTLGAAGLGDGATSASFDGVDNAFVLSAPSLPLGLRTAESVTVEALINVTSLSVDTTFLSRDNYLTGSARAWIFQVTSTGALKATKLGTGDYGIIVSSPTGSIEVGTTYHVAFTHDGTTLRIYINGAMVGSGAASGLMGSSNDAAHLTVGAAGRGTPPNFFPGRLAGVAWTPTALSDARILAHAAAAGLS